MEDNVFSLGEAIKLFMRKSNLKSQLQTINLAKIWEDIMGTTCARYTTKLEIFQKKLIIHTTEAALKQEINYAKTKIIERINEEFGETVINDLVVR